MSARAIGEVYADIPRREPYPTRPDLWPRFTPLPARRPTVDLDQLDDADGDD